MDAAKSFFKFNTPRYSIGKVNLRILVVCASLGLAACDRSPGAFPLPQQEPEFIGFKTHSVRVLNMADADAPSHFVRDIETDLHGTWRWALQRPAVRIRVHQGEGLKYLIDFTLPKITFEDTGPVTIAFTVNDRQLDKVKYVHAGDYHFEKIVPPGWVQAGSDVIVGAEIDKLWISKLDGQKFGFIITRLGLAE